MRIRLVRPWQGRKVGRILEPGDGVANLLIAKRVAVRDDAECIVPAVAASVEIEAEPDQPRRQPRRMRTTA